jgi:hypothetical protein
MTACNLCTEAAVETLIDFGSHPIAHRFLSDPDEDECTHPLVLGLCGRCGLAQLVDPIPPAELYTDYHWLSTWKPNPHVPELVATIERLPGISHRSRVLEIGSNDGAFLAELRNRGFERVQGVEPAVDAAAAAAARDVPTVRGYFTADAARGLVESFGHADLHVARHVLEHVADLPVFAEAMRVVLQAGAHVLVEVPDFDFTQEAPDYSSVWEEHVNHFTRSTISGFLARAGIEVLRFESYSFSGRALVAWGRRVDNGSPPRLEDSPAKLQADAYAYRNRWPAFRTRMHRYLEQQREAGRRIGIYGAGCRAATLLNVCGLGPLVEFAVDDQPEKQGTFMPGSRLPVVAGAELDESAVDLCLLAVNAENEEAVIGRHLPFVDRGGEFVSVHPPSPRLPAFWEDV